jgi:hypothetical protein
MRPSNIEKATASRAFCQTVSVILDYTALPVAGTQQPWGCGVVFKESRQPRQGRAIGTGMLPKRDTRGDDFFQPGIR